MAKILERKRRVTAAQDSTSLHFPNLETKKADDDGQKLENNFSASDLLIDPDDDSGSTHFTNNEKYSEKTNRIHSAAKKPAKKKVKAGMEDDSWDPTEEDPDATFTEEDDPDSGVVEASDESDLEGDGEGVPGDTQHIPNDVDPTKGYITTGNADEFDEDEDETVDASFEDEEQVELTDAEAPQQSLLQVDEEWDPSETVADADEFSDEDDGSQDETSDELDTDEDDESEQLELDAAAKSRVSAGDEMPLVDVDGTDDEGDDVMFATAGLKLHALKGNRIVASMYKKHAVKAGQEDVYLSDEFQDVTYAEMSKHGLRAGLQKMGFALATVNVSKNDTINKRVQAKAQSVTAAVRRQASGRDSVMAQCLAIAAVGINRQGFQGVKNELRASLIDELENAGVRGAKTLVRQVFAAHAVDYSKSMLTLATKLSGMPEVARNAIAASLDMTDESELDDEEDLNGDAAAPDFQAEFADSADEDFAEEMEDEIEEPQTLHAALARPLMKTRATASNRSQKEQTKASASAQAVLAGKIDFGSIFNR
jgi:hypothetical protein